MWLTTSLFIPALVFLIQTLARMALLDYIDGPGIWRLEMLEILGFHVTPGHRAWMLEQNRQYLEQRALAASPQHRLQKSQSRKRTSDFVASLTKPKQGYYKKQQAWLALIKESVGADLIDSLDSTALNVVLTSCMQAAIVETDEHSRSEQLAASALRSEAKKATKAASLAASRSLAYDVESESSDSEEESGVKLPVKRRRPSASPSADISTGPRSGGGSRVPVRTGTQIMRCASASASGGPAQSAESASKAATDSTTSTSKSGQASHRPAAPPSLRPQRTAAAAAREAKAATQPQADCEPEDY